MLTVASPTRCRPSQPPQPSPLHQRGPGGSGGSNRPAGSDRRGSGAVRGGHDAPGQSVRGHPHPDAQERQWHWQRSRGGLSDHLLLLHGFLGSRTPSQSNSRNCCCVRSATRVMETIKLSRNSDHRGTLLRELRFFSVCPLSAFGDGFL